MCSQSNKQIINRFYSDQPRSHEYIFAFFIHTVMACDQPIADRGPCDSSLPRWTYHKSMNKCVVFTYGGCMGNRNNFRTRHECNYNCAQIVRKASRLHLPPAYQAFGDNELRLKFLQARDAWLTSCLEAIPTGDGKPALDLRRKLFWIMIRNNLYFTSIIFNVGIEKRSNHFIYIASLLSHYNVLQIIIYLFYNQLN